MQTDAGGNPSARSRGTILFEKSETTLVPLPCVVKFLMPRDLLL